MATALAAVVLPVAVTDAKPAAHPGQPAAVGEVAVAVSLTATVPLMWLAMLA